MNFTDTMIVVELVQDAQQKVYEAQHELCRAKAELASEVLKVADARQLVEMGILSINLGTIRRFARMEQRSER